MPGQSNNKKNPTLSTTYFLSQTFWSLCLTLHSASGTLVIIAVYLIRFSAAAPLLWLHIHHAELHLLHVICDHQVLPGRKQSFQLVHEVLREKVIIWEFHLWDKWQLSLIIRNNQIWQRLKPGVVTHRWNVLRFVLPRNEWKALPSHTDPCTVACPHSEHIWRRRALLPHLLIHRQTFIKSE